MSKKTLQVVKLGGSLLEFGEWEPHFWRWWRTSNCAQTVVLVGGGTEVDQLRQEQSARGLSETDAHWEAIAVMGRNVRQVAKQLMMVTDTSGLVVARMKQLEKVLRIQPLVFVDPLKLLREDEPEVDGTRLPCSWDVTSDSIAARIAELIQCRSLTLLKSTLPEAAANYAQAADTGYVDRFFPHAAANLDTVACVNLRSAGLETAVLTRA